MIDLWHVTIFILRVDMTLITVASNFWSEQVNLFLLSILNCEHMQFIYDEFIRAKHRLWDNLLRLTFGWTQPWA